MEGVWGMLFQAFEYDIEFRLELQIFARKPSCIFRDIFCMMVKFAKLASEFKNFHEFIKLTS
jgi:hypothetical protein